MRGPRHPSPKFVLALAATLLLPACAPRKAIPSDPPEARSEASVRGARHAAPPQQAAAPAAPVEETVIAEAKDPKDTNAQIKAAVAESEARETELRKQLAGTDYQNTPDATPRPAQAQAANAAQNATAPATAAEAKADAPKPEAAPKAEPTKKVELKDEAQPAPKAEAPKPDAAKAEAAKAETAKTDAKAPEAAQAAAKVYMVQIASFGTEKNADAALAWLKEKGYAEARVVRAEQGQAVYNRVQAGPFQDLAAARKALEELKADWPQAFIPAD